MRSMTGFGRSKYENEDREYIIEIKSVNHKYNDISIKLPRSISYLEEKVKKEISGVISRGKIDVFISFINNSKIGKDIKINTELAEVYIKELSKVCNKTGIIDNINIMDIAKMPDVLVVQSNEDEQIIWKELRSTLQTALDSFMQMREMEGEKLKSDFEKRAEKILQKIDDVYNFSTGLVEEYIVKLKDKIKEFLNTSVIDENRLLQEIVIYADKSSIEEEITRLRSHISQFLQLINQDVSIGRKLDFLLQEMNRETNTIGSKANCLEITNLVVDIKTELENIREQVQNIE
ncbi:MAG: YicC family protein [Lachnospiraceae bacterium]|nr:YicC family protein [Lachnospiraceae bacterium]